MKKILKHLNKKELVLLVLAMMIIVSSISYAFYLEVVSQEGENEISSACFRLTMEEVIQEVQHLQCLHLT